MTQLKTYWAPPMSANQYAVFHFDIKTMSMRDAEGEFLSSRSHSQQKIAVTPNATSRREESAC